MTMYIFLGINFLHKLYLTWFIFAIPLQTQIQTNNMLPMPRLTQKKCLKLPTYIITHVITHN